MAAESIDDLVRAKIELWRTNRGLTQEALARAAGHNQSWYSAWQAGAHNAGLEELHAMVRAVDQSLWSLFERRPDALEDELLTRFRALAAPGRTALIAIARELVADPKPPRGGRGRR